MIGHATRAQWGADVRGTKSRDRRVALLKRAGLFGTDPQGTRILRAVSLEDLRDAYRLVYDVYVRKGYILPDQSGLRIRPFEALFDTATFVAKADAAVVGVISLLMDSLDFGLPSDGAFRAELDSLRGQGRKICEATNQVVADSHRSSALTTELMRCAFAHALSVGCTDFVGTVSPGHASFYELLGFRRISEVRSYSDKIDDPVVVVCLDLSSLGERFADMDRNSDEVEAFLKAYYIDENPYHQHVAAWQVLSDSLFADATLLRELFVRQSNFLPRCDPEVLDAMRRRWGRDLFQRVWAAHEQPVLAP